MASVIRMAAVTLLSVLLGAATGHPHRKHCHLSKYRTISPGEMAELRELQNHEEEMAVGVKCHHGLRLKRFPQCDIKGEERLTLTLHRVSLAVEVLQNLSDSDRGHRSLDIFSSLKKDLSSCKMRNSSVLESCRGHLMKYSETVSAECLRRDVLLSLVWLLVEDVRLLVPGEYNVRETQKEAPQPPPTETAPQKHPNRRRNHRRGTRSRPPQRLPPKNTPTGGEITEGGPAAAPHRDCPPKTPQPEEESQKGDPQPPAIKPKNIGTDGKIGKKPYDVTMRECELMLDVLP